MEGLFLLILALILLIAEAHVPSFGILGISGIIAILAGGDLIIEQGGIFGFTPDWSFFIGLAVFAALTLVFYGWVIRKNYWKKPVAGIEGMVGHDAKIVDWSGTSGRVHVQGELWAAQSEHPHDFREGDTVTISGVHDMSLRIHLKP